MTGPAPLDDFEAHRGFLAGLAYRMLGSVADSEDVVQDAFLRWHSVDRAAVAEPRAYLARVVSRLCLDRMKSAQQRREQYVGTWLPEPVVAEPAERLADDLSVALLLALERLSPLERAAFLLHDVFDMDYSAVAEVLDRGEPACRQLAARARAHLQDKQPRYEPRVDEAERLAQAFLTAAATGDVDALSRMLKHDAVLYTDGGGKRIAALNPIFGKEKIVRFYRGLQAKGRAFAAVRLERVMLNGLPGIVFDTREGTETVAFEVTHGEISAIYAVRNPDKLRHFS